jgi:hypothetical protein
VDTHLTFSTVLVATDIKSKKNGSTTLPVDNNNNASVTSFTPPLHPTPFTTTMESATRRKTIFHAGILGCVVMFAFLSDQHMINVVKQKSLGISRYPSFSFNDHPSIPLETSTALPGSNVTRIRNLTNFVGMINQTEIETSNGHISSRISGDNQHNSTINATNQSWEQSATTDNIQFNDSSSSSSNGSTVPTPSPLAATLAVHLSGEFGNHLSHLARAYGIAQMAQEEFNITIRLLLKQQTTSRGNVLWHKAMPSQKFLQKCFPAFRGLDFGLGNRWLRGDRDDEYFVTPKGLPLLDGRLDDTRKRLATWKEYLRNSTGASAAHLSSGSNHTAAMLGFPPDLMAETQFTGYDQWFQTYYDTMKHEIFQFDDRACCDPDMQPFPDESVFHHRGFATEMPTVYKKMGFEELPPKLIATQLFGHLQPGDKVAVLGRFVKDEAQENSTNPTQQIVMELEGRGIQVRTVGDGDAMHDFCFLKNAQKELVGGWKSTFLKWAFFLGDMKMARFYAYDSPINRKFYGDNLASRTNVTFPHPALVSRHRFEVYEA